MEIYIIEKTRKVYTKKELLNLFKEMRENGVEFLDKFDLPFRGTYVNERTFVYTYRYKNGNSIIEMNIERIKI